jgi:(p)ppGpp synthase/HD superfamily hydrolase
MTEIEDGRIDPQRPAMTIGAANVHAAQPLASKAHHGQVDKAGLPYIEHPERVAGYLVNPTAEETVVAWLHDVVEDTDVTGVTNVTLDVENAFGPQVAAAVDAITRRPGEQTHIDAYYAWVKANPIALTVKAADIADNTDPSRLQLLTPKKRAALEAKYAHARCELGIE